MRTENFLKENTIPISEYQAGNRDELTQTAQFTPNFGNFVLTVVHRALKLKQCVNDKVTWNFYRGCRVTSKSLFVGKFYSQIIFLLVP